MKGIKNKVNDNYFKTENSLWLVGLLAADGCITDDTHITISQSGDNGKEMINYIKKIINFGGNVYERKTSRKMAYSISICSKMMVEDLKNYNVIPKKSLIYSLPDLINKNNINSYIRGYFEGDGSIGVYNNGNSEKYLIISLVGTKEFIDELSKIIPYKYSSIRKLKANNCYEIRWNGSLGIEFGRWLFSDKNLYKSKKCRIFEEYLENCENRFLKYKDKKIEVEKLLKTGMSPMLIAKEVGLAFQTVYRWKANLKNSKTTSKQMD